MKLNLWKKKNVRRAFTIDTISDVFVNEDRIDKVKEMKWNKTIDVRFETKRL